MQKTNETIKEKPITMRYTNQQVTSYKLISLRVALIAWVTSYELLLLHELWVIVYCTSYELLFITPVTNYFLHTTYGLIFICKLQVTFNYELQ